MSTAGTILFAIVHCSPLRLYKSICTYVIWLDIIIVIKGNSIKDQKQFRKTLVEFKFLTGLL